MIGVEMKKIFAVILFSGTVFWPLACGKNLSPTVPGPVTVVEMAPTATPNPLAGQVWLSATQSAAFGQRFGHTSVVFDNEMWVISGFTGATGYVNDVWYSPDGANWTQATSNGVFNARRNHTSLVYNNKMWIIGGFYGSSYYNDVWDSLDGATWNEATPGAAFSGRFNHSSLVYDNKMW